MRRFEDLDYRTAPAQLLELLESRYYWDIGKLVVAIAYPVSRVALFLLQPDLPEWLPLTSLFDLPSIGSMLISALIAYLQWKNIERFRYQILPKAESVAFSHGKRRKR